MTTFLTHCVSYAKYGVYSGPYFPTFGLNTGKYGPEKSPDLDTSRSGLRVRAETYSEPSRIMKTWLFEELFSQKASSWIFNWVLDKPMA